MASPRPPTYTTASPHLPVDNFKTTSPSSASDSDTAPCERRQHTPAPASHMATPAPNVGAAASFWSSKRQSEATHTSTPTNSEPSSKHTTAPISPPKSPSNKAIENGMVFKRKEMARIFDDSDDEDDIEWPASFLNATARDRIKKLEADVAARDEKIKALEDEAIAKAAHVADLEDATKRKRLHISELVALCDEKARYTRILEGQLEEQAVYIQQLTAKVATLEAQCQKSDEGVTDGIPTEPVLETLTLETSLPQEHMIPKEAASSPPIPDEPALDTPALEAPTTEMQASETSAVETLSPQKPMTPKESAHGPCSPRKTVAGPSTPTSSSKTTSSNISTPAHASTGTIPQHGISEDTCSTNTTLAESLSAGSPAPCDFATPFFATPETVAKMKSAPPAPPAPILRFPNNNSIKTNKNSTSEKDTKSSLVLPKLSTLDPSISKGAWSATGWLPDIRNLLREQREDLGRGPKVAIKMREAVYRDIPKRMFTQVSEKANYFFTKNPRAEVMTFEGGMAPAALKEIINWMLEMTKSPKEFSLKIRFPQHTEHADAQNLAIMGAARFLGMSTYIRHFTRHYCDQIRQRLLPLETIALIEKYAAPKDPVFECLVNNLAHHRTKQSPADQADLDNFLLQHAILAAAVERANAAIQEKRSDRNVSRRVSSGTRSSGSVSSGY